MTRTRTPRVRESSPSQLRFDADRCASAKVIVAVKRLEKLRCLNTAQVVFMWGRTVAVVDAVNRDAWGLTNVGRKTLAFYRSHETGRLRVLSVIYHG